MKKVLVIFHLYYKDQLPYFLDKLSHIHGCDWDLCVTGPSFDPESQASLRAFKSDVSLITCENVGYDIWPFLHALQVTGTDAYDLVLKLHTKSNTGDHKIRIGGVHLREYMWRDTLVDALLQDRERWEEVLNIFESRPDAGMVCSRKLYCKLNFKEDHALLDEELSRIGLQTQERRFCVGTMMLLRADLFKALPLAEFRAEQFPRESASNSGGTIAHIYERILSLLAPAQGFQVYTTGSDAAFERKQKIRRFTKPLLDFLFSIDRKGEDGAKYLTILGISIRL